MARNPNNLQDNDFKDPEDKIYIEDVPPFTFEDLDPNDMKSVRKYIARIEKVIRTSTEYRSLICFLKDSGEMNQDSFLYVSGDENQRVHIELHHEPVTLYDMVWAIYNRRLQNRESIHEDMVAKEVMYNHYKLHVGLIPLAKTVHELVHNGFLFIPCKYVLGNWKQFVEDYRDYMALDTLANIEEIEKRSENYDFDEETKVLLAKMTRVEVEQDGYQLNDQEKYNYIKEEVLDSLNDQQGNPYW